jgi:hypothetical protein
MRITQSVLVALFLIVSSLAWGADGLIVVKSPHKPKHTMDR